MRAIHYFLGLTILTILSHNLSAQNWMLSGNSGTTPTTNWLGTNDDQRLVFKVNNVEAATLSKFLQPDQTISYGLGIGTSEPNHTFSIVGGNGFSVARPGGTNYVYFEPTDFHDWAIGLWNGGFNTDLKIDARAVMFGTRDSYARVGIQTAPDPNAALDVAGRIFSSNAIAIGTKDLSKIGTHSLAVNGSGIFTQVKVQVYPSGWPDYVFDKKYRLPSLQEVDDYVKKHGHLPDVPSAEDVKKNDLDLGSTQAVLLKKIEELTLYAIEQSKKLKELELQIVNLKQKANN